MPAEKILAISCRDESCEDFINIGKRVHRLDSSIIVSINNGRFDPAQLPPQFNHLRLLTLYLVNPPAHMPRRGHTLAVRNVGKIAEYEGFVAAGVPIPKAHPFQIGDTVDPDEWGPYVILKPSNLSFGVGVLLVPTRELGALRREVIPEGHLLHTEPYLLQQYVDTGGVNEIFRVLCFLGEPLFCVRTVSNEPWHPPNSIEECITIYPFATSPVPRQRSLVLDKEVITFARRAFEVHADYPLQGIDVMREKSTGMLYVLENNSGGNVWTFSKKDSNILRVIGRQPLVRQFNAWDRAAEVLVKKTNELAK